MTDISQTPAAAPAGNPKGGSLFEKDARTKRRNAAESRFKLYGIAAIGIGLIMLIVLVTNIVTAGTGAFQQSFLELNVELKEDKLDKKGNRNIEDIKKVSTFGYAPLIASALEAEVQQLGIQTDLSPKDMGKILSKAAQAELRNYVIANPDEIGKTVSFRFLVNSRVDGYMKGRVTRESIANDKSITAAQLDFVDQLRDTGVLYKAFNPDFIFGSDASDQRPEAAGIGGINVGLAVHDVCGAGAGAADWCGCLNLP